MRNTTHISINELYNYCSEEGVIHFSAKDENSVIYVHTKGKFLSYVNDSNDTDGRMPIALLACHCGENANKTFISRESMEQALPSFQLRPILANIIKKPDGSWDFGSHDMKLVDSPFEGEETRVEYIERQVGTIYGEVKIIYDEDTQVDRVLANGFLEVDYGNGAAEIIAQRGTVEVSVELALHEFTFNKEKGILDITKFRFAGVTLLGADKSAGMVGSIAYLSNYSTDNNSETLDMEKGGMLMENENITVNDANEENDVVDTEFEVNDIQEQNEETNVTDSTDETEISEQSIDEDNVDDDFDNSTIYTINYELSFNDIRVKLYRAVDSDIYIVDVYESHFYYETYADGESTFYRREYVINNDQIELVGEPIRVYPMFVTQEEKDELEIMRNSYPELVEYHDNNEARILSEQKQAIINDEYYDSIRDTEGFKNIVSNLDSYSIEDLQKEIDSIYVNEGKKTFNYSGNNRSTSVKVNTFQTETNTDPYGDLFKE